MLRRAIFLSVIALLAALAVAVGWLGTTESGLQSLVRLAGTASGGRLQIEQAHGRLLGRFSVDALRWTTPTLGVQAEGIEFDWSPGALLDGRLHIGELRLARLRIDSAPSSEPTLAPSELLLPLAVDVENLAISRLEYGDLLMANEVFGRLRSDGRQHRLSDFRTQLGGISLGLQAALDGAAPLQLEASAEIAGQLDERPLALNLQANGPLERLAVVGTARAGLEGKIELVLTPFAPAFFANAQVALDNIDPAAWQAAAPHARLSLRADLEPAGAGVAGQFSLRNAQPGQIDKQRLPLSALSGKLDWQGERARLDGLTATLPGTGELSGQGQWQSGTLSLDLVASRLDAAQLHASLRSTRLNGPISLTLSAAQQAVKLALHDATYKLAAEASHAAGQITLQQLELAAGSAQLAAHGALDLNQGMAFSAEGELNRFDPSRFGKLPVAQINAAFKATGKLAPRPIIDGSFTVNNSRLADQSLSGRGQLRIDWPRLPQVDIALTAGANHLLARGAYGNPGDTLTLDIDAPQLASYGVEGGISGHLDLAGSVAQPKINARLQAARLGRAGLGDLRDLRLTAEIGPQANSPLRVDLAIARLAIPEKPDLAKALQVHVDGSNQAHRWRAGVELPGQRQLALAAEGGLSFEPAAPLWRGRLLEAELKNSDKGANKGANQAQQFRLAAPAALLLGKNQWAFGPAQLIGDALGWQATLQATADARHLQASLQARGPRLGQIDGQLDAAMRDAWSLDSLAPWQGKLKSEINDLAWLAELLGDSWQSAGRFSGELKLLGTPAQPLASGRFRGEQLALRLPEQGLNLVRGELDVDLDDNLLRVKKLSFASPLQAMPRPLRLAARDETEALLQQPGRLEISGEMRVDRNKGADNAFLDFHLDRLGVFQLPEQWVAISGDGRLTWQGDTLGAKGKLAVDAGYWQLAPSGAPRLSDDVVIKRAGAAPPASGLRPKLDVDLAADLGKNFLFKGAGLSTRLVGDLRLRASGRDLPRASGSIRTRDGRFDAYGQQLAIARGVLTFQGLLDNPALDVRAVRQGLSVEPGVQISGTVQRPVVKLISDPELPDSEKLAWLVLGHGPEQMSAGDATLLLSAAGGLLGNEAGGVVQQLKQGFGIDEFGVRQGSLGDVGGRAPSSRVAGSSVDTTAATGNQIFSVGKRLSSNAMLSYEQTLGKAESIVKLTVNLTRRISVIGRAGSDNALDVFYTLSFGREAASRPAK